MRVHFGSIAHIAPNPIVYLNNNQQKEVITAFKQPANRSVQQVTARLAPQESGRLTFEVNISPQGFSNVPTKPDSISLYIPSSKPSSGRVRYFDEDSQDSPVYRFKLNNIGQLQSVFDVSDPFQSLPLSIETLPIRVRNEIEDTNALFEQIKTMPPNAFTAMA